MCQTATPITCFQSNPVPVKNHFKKICSQTDPTGNLGIYFAKWASEIVSINQEVIFMYKKKHIFTTIEQYVPIWKLSKSYVLLRYNKSVRQGS